MGRRNLIIFTASFFVATALAAGALVLGIGGTPEDLKGITFKIAAGVMNHQGTISAITGNLQIDPVSQQIISGGFAVPIAQIFTGNEKRDCHMREALGLDYTISDFPKDHVCDAENKLPESGNNAVAFPEIALEIHAIRMAGTTTPANFSLSIKQDVEVDATWTLHGVRKTATINAQLEKLANEQHHLAGKTVVLLSDFGIQIKPFAGVNVDNKAHVSVDVILNAVTQ